MTAFGGRRVGSLSLLLSLLACIFILFDEHSPASLHDLRNITELGLILLVGLLIVYGVDAMRRNAQLLADAKAHAAREALLRRFQEETQSAPDTEVLQDRAASQLAKALNADRCYFSRYNLSTGVATTLHEWRRPDLPTMLGEHRLPPEMAARRQVAGKLNILRIDDTQDSLLGEETKRFFQERRLRAVASIPLRLSDDSRMTLSLAMADEPRHWNDEDIALVSQIAVQMQVAIEISRVHLREHNIASVLQESLLPSVQPSLDGLEVTPFYRPALAEAEVGGDFYDVFTISPDIFALVVGDVSGKGLAAAVQVATVRNMLRCLLYREQTVSEAINQLNNIATRHDLLSGFVTLFVGLYYRSSRLLRYVSCGHEPALLRRTKTGAVEELAPTGPILGAMEGVNYDEMSVTLAEGDMLAVYTDGMTDAGPDFNRFLGVRGLAALLRGEKATDTKTVADNLLRGVEIHAEGALRDDACLLVARA